MASKRPVGRGPIARGRTPVRPSAETRELADGEPTTTATEPFRAGRAAADYRRADDPADRLLPDGGDVLTEESGVPDGYRAGIGIARDRWVPLGDGPLFLVQYRNNDVGFFRGADATEVYFARTRAGDRFISVSEVDEDDV